MVSKEVKAINQRNIQLQNNMNKGWSIGPITVVLMMVLFAMYMASFGFGWWG